MDELKAATYIRIRAALVQKKEATSGKGGLGSKKRYEGESIVDRDITKGEAAKDHLLKITKMGETASTRTGEIVGALCQQGRGRSGKPFLQSRGGEAN